MTAPGATQSPGVVRPPTLREIRRAVSVAEQLLAVLSDLTQTTELDVWELRGRCRVSSLDLGEVLRLGAGGHVATVRIEDEGWSLTARSDSPARPGVDLEGAPREVLTSNQIEQLARAVDHGNALEALRVVGHMDCLVRVVLRNDATRSGAHWIRHEAALEEELESSRWPAVITKLATGPRLLLVDTVGDAQFTTRGLYVCGPDAPGLALTAGELADAGYRQARARDGRDFLPSPDTFAGTGTATGRLSGLQRLFNGVARCLSWYWLAANIERNDAGNVVATFSGARVSTLELRPAPIDDCPADLALYRWATEGNDPGRNDAIQHGASLAATSAEDLPSAAEPALRTARTLYELSRRHAVSDALTANRSAREAALNAARQAAEAARQTAGKSVERSLVQLAAAVGVVLSNATNLLGRFPATLLLLAVAGLPLISLAVARRVELTSATHALDAELADLDQYRDALASTDVDAVRAIRAVAEARADLRRTARVATWIYFGSAVAIVVLGLIMIYASGSGHTAAVQPDSRSTPRRPPSITQTESSSPQPPPSPDRTRPALPNISVDPRQRHDSTKPVSPVPTP
jgi:hypothetical protein